MHEHFPSINRIANARATFARTARENELQPGRVQEQTQRNELRQFDIGSAQAGVDSAARVAELNAADQAGDLTAFGKLIRENPDRARKQLEVVAKQRKMKVDAFERGALQIGRFATVVAGLAGDPESNPEQAQADYTRLREALFKRNPELTDDDVPPKLSRGFLKSAIGFASDLSTLQKQAGFGQGQKIITGGTGKPGETQQRRVDVSGAPGPVAPPAVAAVKGGGKGGGGGGGDEGFQLKAADSNAIRAAANSIYGTLYDPDGNLIITDPQSRVKALRLTARAEKIFQRARARGAPMAHNTAVEQAAEELGITQADFSAGTTVRDQRSPSGRSVERTGTTPKRGRGAQTRQQQLDAFEDFTNRLK